MILEVSGINTYYGTSHILFDVALHMKQGELVCLLGRNGSGKTTGRICGADPRMR
jgi:ABC-type branched-subunit amino acid transport system ATPase component